MQETKKGEIIIYKDQVGPEIEVKLENDTVWLNQAQMAALFGKDRDTISEHIQNVYKEAELSQNQTTRKFRAVRKEGLKEVEREVGYYNLDVIISVGYRVRSKRGTQFRIWATQRLRDYIVKGFVVNENRLNELKKEHDLQLTELRQTARLFQNLIEAQKATGYEKELLSIISDYATTWAVLNLYDKGELKIQDVSKKQARCLKHEEIQKTILQFKKRLEAKKEAGSLFGQEVGEKFKALLGNIEQTFEGKQLYPSIEEKAAHLFYFCIKDHPFADGNKRIGSLLFLIFLVENNFLMNKKGQRKINDTALAALALLVAESDRGQKDVMVKLVVNLIK